jgi:hypothetical protein
MAKLLNGSCLNHVFEQMGLPYASRPLPGTEASQAVTKKRKFEMSKKLATKKTKAIPSRATLAKMVPLKKISILKVIRPKAKPGPKGKSEIELALVKPVGVSKKFCLLDALRSSHGLHNKVHTMTKVDERAPTPAWWPSIISVMTCHWISAGPPRQKRLRKCLRHFGHQGCSEHAEWHWLSREKLAG